MAAPCPELAGGAMDGMGVMLWRVCGFTPIQAKATPARLALAGHIIPEPVSPTLPCRQD
ncbi:hypothetical protein THIX_10088 [Thiomonas sp. X19]|nr:hypothetical protein THIX_10088 [Thiomonas sp. X19]